MFQCYAENGFTPRLLMFLSAYRHVAPEDLPALGFQTFEILETGRVGEFVLRFIGRHSWLRNIFFSIIFLIVLLCIIWVKTAPWSYNSIKPIEWIFWGMLAFFALIPVHEGLHALAYRLSGARNVRVEAHWRQGYFLALAPRFVADRRSFFFVAFLPFVLITGAHGLTIVFIKAEWVTGVWGSLIMHTLGCVGDFSVVRLFLDRSDCEVVTYDDLSGTTYFLYRKKTG
ncbi:MAG: DUF3267 domain-containing protein [Flavobacteriales bacterium]|nr:DUF3267 domain-containing protein [Flavobacteriales bacterium]MDW8432822.1 DUF3267 domain-containing protein [Flavobacteriales bacterium]